MKNPTSTKTKTVITGPTIPQDIVNEIADHLAIDSDFQSIRACALLSKSSVQPCRRHLFRIVTFTPRGVDSWFKTFPVPEESYAHYVRDLRIWIGGGGCVPEKFFKHTPWFTNVEKISLLGYGGVPLLRKTSLWRLPQSATSLTIDTGVVDLVQVRDVIAQLPNLDDLFLSGSHVGADREELLGIGTVLKGRFGGKLTISDKYAGEDIINMLIEVPSGLRFTEVQVSCTRRSLPLAFRLAEACGKTLVKLSYTVTLVHYDLDVFDSSFSFSKFPNLQEVNFAFRFGWINGGLPWIPGVLSTLRPTTSPCLSAVRLEFTCDPTAAQPIESLIREVGNHFRQVADEVARIEREFDGAVNFTVVPDPKFEVVLGRLNILQRHRR